MEVRSGTGTHVAKVARENVECHRGRGLRDWDGRQDREERDDVNDADAGADDELEADGLGKTAVCVQRREQAGADDGEGPARVCWDQVFAGLLDCDARYDCDEADAVRQPEKVDAGSGGRPVLACLEEDGVPVCRWCVGIS